MTDLPASLLSADEPRACILGWPVDQSRSPLLHGYWLKRYGLRGSYGRLPVPPDAIAGFLARYTESGLVGGNVTVPHKEAALAACDHVEPAGIAIGAVNTVWVDGGRLCGTNTDWLGFLGSLDEDAPGWDEAPGPAVVLGAGGAGRAIAYALIQRGFAPRIVNRDRARAEALAADLGHGASAHGWDEAQGLLADARVLANSTSIGMKGAGTIPLDLSGLPEDAVVSDAVYVPLETGLLAEARRRGLRTVDGIGMLLHQAVPGFARWFGRVPEVTADLRDLIVADIPGAR